MTLFPDPGPRVHALPPGADFARQFAAGLRARLAGGPPEAMARITVLVGTDRMRKRIAACLAEGRPTFLPRLRLIADLGRETVLADVAPAVPPLRRRLELSVLIDRLLQAQPGLAPRAALYDLSDSLAALLDEMQGEGVAPDTIAALDVSQHSAHWARTQAFMGIVAPFFGSGAPPDAEARQRLVVARLAADWAVAPPAGPVIVAGSTGTRGPTLRLMQAVAALAQGALVLPGFDPDVPPEVWTGMAEAGGGAGEDHPQFRFLRVLAALGLTPGDVRPWTAAPPPDPLRNRLVSLSLRPAPVTDRWLSEGAGMPDLGPVTRGMTLIEADTPRAEAMAIALILRQAAEDGRTAALVAADRGLTRQVTAALDRWRIRPDDSAGEPLSLTAPGRLLRQVAEAMAARLTAEALLALMKHPLVASGAARGAHLDLTRALELRIRRKGPPYPTAAMLRDWAAGAGAADWGDWLVSCLPPPPGPALPLADHLARHRALAERLAAGPPATGAGALWDRAEGAEARAAVEALEREAAHGGLLTAADYRDLVATFLAGLPVRETVAAHPRILIWGPREVRAGGADLVILGGLNDGVWPERPAPDPWLNRDMRRQAGLLPPERRIGLAAHDYQQAIGAREVVLTRAKRDDQAETVPSRWLNRLTNLLDGLPDRGGKAALAAMQDRGTVWLRQAAQLDQTAAADRPAPAPRPAPRPPAAVRPRRLSVTEIQTLIRDPYAVYARHVLGLRPLDPLRAVPDALLRGTVLHLILQQFAEGRQAGGVEATGDAIRRLRATAAAVLDDAVPWPAARALWQARIDRAAPFLAGLDRAWPGEPLLLERKERLDIDPPGVTLSVQADRIDLLPDGTVRVIDYKTGSPPSKPVQRLYDKQLMLTAVLVECGAFHAMGARRVSRVTYVGLGAEKVEDTPVTPDMTRDTMEGLRALLWHFLTPSQGYASRRLAQFARFDGDYDHLARYGEWEMTDTPKPEDVA